MTWISQIWILFQALAAKTVKKESNSPNQKIRFDVVWMGADALAPATLQPQSFKKEWKPTRQQPDLITFSSFGSLNLSKRNQSHQTRRPELTCFESARFDYFFNRWHPKPVQKKSESSNQKIRIVELKWIESDRFAYFLKLWQSKPVQKASKSPNQKIRFNMV